MPEFRISQSGLKDFTEDTCLTQWADKYIKGNKTSPSDVMLRGQYFEHHLIGATRDGNIPELPKLQKGGKSQAEKDLDELVIYAKAILDKMEVVPLEVQPEITTDKFIIHPDLIAFYKAKCLIDIKYTETQEDDRWRGWGDPQNMPDHTQARFYSFVYWVKTGELLPFYYFVFGKSGWVKVIDASLTMEDIQSCKYAFENQADYIKMMFDLGDPAPKPEFNKCRKCHLMGTCPHQALIPGIEKIYI